MGCIFNRKNPIKIENACIKKSLNGPLEIKCEEEGALRPLVNFKK